MKGLERSTAIPTPRDPESDSGKEEIISSDPDKADNVVYLSDYRDTEIVTEIPSDRKPTAKMRGNRGTESESILPKKYDVNFIEVEKNLQEATVLPPSEFIDFVKQLQLDERDDPWLGLGNQSEAIEKYREHRTQEHLEAISTTSGLRGYVIEVVGPVEVF